MKLTIDLPDGEYQRLLELADLKTKLSKNMTPRLDLEYTPEMAAQSMIGMHLGDDIRHLRAAIKLFKP